MLRRLFRLYLEAKTLLQRGWSQELTQHSQLRWVLLLEVAGGDSS